MKKLAIFVFIFVLGKTSVAQQKTFPFGVIESIESSELKETRILNIYLPQGYHADSAKTYPVIYLLDGSAHEDYPHMAGLVQFLGLYALMPPSIVVGIANVDRYRDFTTPTMVTDEKKKLPTSGGSAAFILFMEKELQPFIAKKFHVNDSKTIIGQSLGGLLATEILFYRPYLFSQYIIVSPSLWWNNSIMLKDAKSALTSHKTAGKKIYIAVGDEPEDMITGAQKLEEAIRKYTANNEVLRESFPRETHATILHRAVYSAFEWIYPAKK